MPPDRLERLRERLLGAGVAPRHVKRYLHELRDHQEDAECAELARGAPLAEAREAAWSRLGSEESLVQNMLAHPELRSRAARFPALVFGLGPVLTWVGAPIVIALLVSVVPASSRHIHVDALFIDAYHALGFGYARLLPVLLGALVLGGAAERRSRSLWPFVGAGAVDVLAGTLTVYSLPGELGLTSWLLPWLLPFSKAFGPRDTVALGEGIARAACWPPASSSSGSFGASPPGRRWPPSDGSSKLRLQGLQQRGRTRDEAEAFLDVEKRRLAAIGG